MLCWLINYEFAKKGLVVLYLAGALLSGLSYGVVLFTPPSLNPITLAQYREDEILKQLLPLTCTWPKSGEAGLDYQFR